MVRIEASMTDQLDAHVNYIVTVEVDREHPCINIEVPTELIRVDDGRDVDPVADLAQITLAGGAETAIRLDVADAAFAGAVIIAIDGFGIDTVGATFAFAF
jgi:hypothetical protein